MYNSKLEPRATADEKPISAASIESDRPAQMRSAPVNPPVDSSATGGSIQPVPAVRGYNYPPIPVYNGPSAAARLTRAVTLPSVIAAAAQNSAAKPVSKPVLSLASGRAGGASFKFLT